MRRRHLKCYWRQHWNQLPFICNKVAQNASNLQEEQMYFKGTHVAFLLAFAPSTVRLLFITVS